MNDYSNVYLDMIYEWNEEELIKQTIDISKKEKSKEIFDINSKVFDLVWESTYFDKVDNVFEDWFSLLFDNFIKEAQEAAKNGQEYDLYKEVKISDIINHLPKNKIKNYKNFHNFLDILKNSNGYVTIELTNESNCYEPPYEWTGKKIKIKDRLNNLLDEPLDKAGELYKDYMNQLTKKCNTLSEKYAKIKNEILKQIDFGSIKINYRYFKDEERYEYKKLVITHEFGHLLDYLIKINAENWNIGRQYRANIIHSDFDPNNMNEQNRINYFNNEDEFQHLASTYIECLKIIFKKNCINNKDKNEIALFFEAIMNSFEIKDIHYCKIIDTVKYTKYVSQIQKHFYFQDMKDFFNIIYKDSLQKSENIGSRNKWTILKKWLRNEFLKH